MNTEEKSGLKPLSDREFHLLLAAGALLTVLSGMRFGVQELGWVAGAPYLVAMMDRSGKRDHLWLLFYVTAGVHLSVFKIITPPLGAVMTIVFALPSALGMFALLAIWAFAVRRLGVLWGIYLFPAMAVTSEWMAYSSNLGPWGAAGVTQVDNLPLVQLTAIAGLPALSFLVALGSSVTAAVARQGFGPVKAHVALFAALFLSAQGYGQWRLAQDAPGKTIRVGAVASPLPVARFREVINDTSIARAWDDELFARTALAADLGARVVVWNEAATLLSRDDEAALVERGRKLAQERGIDIVMAIGTLLKKEPLSWDNKYYWIGKTEAVADIYRKLHPTPWEASIPGDADAAAVEVDGLKLTGAICYDYDSPQIALANAASGAGLAVIPSSDWKGIDPIHSHMARMQGVAVGISTFRSVRAATSFAADQYGRITGAMRFNSPTGVMVADLPVERIPTLYAATGDILPWFMAIFSLATIGLAAARKLT
ncbi:MAG: hypothetical protein OEV92_04525 [Nitrospinota bacterium]|nr:hypothetical protein [Nitrospinota bacterium]